jgi:hypothetical protein
MRGYCGSEFVQYGSYCEKECRDYEQCLRTFKEYLEKETAQGDNHPVLPIKEESKIKEDIISNKNKFKSLPKILEGELMAFKEDLKTLTIDTLIRQLELY